jgi:AraC-like DNA-binding protein
MLAGATNIPRATLTRRFASPTSKSPMAYSTAWRMSAAARRLRDGDATLRLIARELGYESEFAFARAFKRATGEAPGRYRQQVRTAT